MNHILHLSNADVREAVDQAVLEIANSKIQFNHIIGIGRGSLVPAGFLSYRLGNLPVTCLPSPPTYSLCEMLDLQNKNILVVDNISTTGITINNIINEFKQLASSSTNSPASKSEMYFSFGELRSCVLYARPSAVNSISFIGEQIAEGTRIIFPWDSTVEKRRSVQYGTAI